jgi:hypothetical protein
MTLRTRGSGALALALLLAGCSSLQPVQGPVPAPGTRLAFDVNDAGRVALGGAMGPEIAQVEGQLLGNENGAYLVAVSGVTYLRGGHQTWSGETVRLRPEYIGNTYERKASTGRSIAMGVATVGGFTVFLVGRSLVTGGQDEDDDGDDDKPLPQERRIRP